MWGDFPLSQGRTALTAEAKQTDSWCRQRPSHLWQLPFWPGSISAVVIRPSLFIHMLYPLQTETPISLQEELNKQKCICDGTVGIRFHLLLCVLRHVECVSVFVQLLWPASRGRPILAVRLTGVGAVVVFLWGQWLDRITIKRKTDISLMFQYYIHKREQTGQHYRPDKSKTFSDTRNFTGTMENIDCTFSLFVLQWCGLKNFYNTIE